MILRQTFINLKINLILSSEYLQQKVIHYLCGLETIQRLKKILYFQNFQPSSGQGPWTWYDRVYFISGQVIWFGRPLYCTWRPNKSILYTGYTPLTSWTYTIFGSDSPNESEIEAGIWRHTHLGEQTNNLQPYYWWQSLE